MSVFVIEKYGGVVWEKIIAYEQDGKNNAFERPVLVLKKFNIHVLWIIPLTRSGKENGYYHKLREDSKNSFLVLSQVRLVSSRRLLRRMRRIKEDEFVEICKKVKSFI